MTFGLVVLGTLAGMFFLLAQAIVLEIRNAEDLHKIGYAAMSKRLAILTESGVEYDPVAVSEARISVMLEFVESKDAWHFLRGVDDAIVSYEREWGAP